jgi:hypothetical protein
MRSALRECLEERAVVVDDLHDNSVEVVIEAQVLTDMALTATGIRRIL